MSEPEVKLSRPKLEAAVIRMSSRMLPRGTEADALLLERATRALLAVMEPASDVEIYRWMDDRGGVGGAYGKREAWRAAEARARKLANWSDE